MQCHAHLSEVDKQYYTDFSIFPAYLYYSEKVRYLIIYVSITYNCDHTSEVAK